jgi:hypothetical protein
VTGCGVNVIKQWSSAANELVMCHLMVYNFKSCLKFVPINGVFC